MSKKVPGLRAALLVLDKSLNQNQINGKIIVLIGLYSNNTLLSVRAFDLHFCADDMITQLWLTALKSLHILEIRNT